VRWVFASFFLQKDSASYIQDVPFASFPLAGQRKRSRTWPVGPVCSLCLKKKLLSFIFKGILEKFPLFVLQFVTRPRPALSKNRNRTKKTFMISEKATYVIMFV